MLAPENTLAAFDLAARLGVRGVEFDVMLTADHHPILMHDTRLGRTLPGKGRVAAYSLAELQALDAGAWLGPEWQGEGVPTLPAALERLLALGLWFNLEIKPTRGLDAATAHRIADVLQEHWPVAGGTACEGLPLISSFSFDALQVMQERMPQLPRGLLVDRIPRNWLHQLNRLEATALHVREDRLEPARLDPVLREGFAIMAYTVNDVARASELRRWGVDAICTDRPDLILTLNL